MSTSVRRFGFVRTHGALALLVALSGLGAPARAQNLVVNPGFEGGVYLGPFVNPLPNGYTLTGSNGGGANDAVASGPGVAHTGSNAFVFGDRAPAGATLSQTIATVAGTPYQISFFATNGGTGSLNLLVVAFGGPPLFNNFVTNSTYQQFTYVTTATGASTSLDFFVSNAGGSVTIDDLSVVSLAPEPLSLALVGSGLLGVAAFSRRRRRAPS